MPTVSLHVVAPDVVVSDVPAFVYSTAFPLCPAMILAISSLESFLATCIVPMIYLPGGIQELLQLGLWQNGSEILRRMHHRY